ncbi:MAG: DUF4234 domain-containing protein [Oscillospiraceae bacterium]|nr:DUF4234 domain-containing protein [Oscillospiraceae bacterium]
MVGKTESPVTLIILSIVTCGIYFIIWSFRVTKEINDAAGRELVPGWAPIAGIFIVFVEMFFMDKAMQEFMPMKGKSWDSKFVLWLLLSFVGVGAIMYLYQMQTALNEAWASGQ